MCEVGRAEFGDLIGRRCIVTLPYPLLTWQKSLESLMRAPLGNTTFPFALKVNCDSDNCHTIFTTS